MYLTSDELLKHMLSQHGVVRWVCDHCATKSAADETFIFSSFQDWEGHMRREHPSVSTASQLLSLSKVSQRKMLEPQKCPLCGFAAEHSSSILDDHITKHLHGFALRCLPWGTGGDDADSVNAKSADASHSSDATEESVVDGEESSYLNATESDSPDRLCDLLIRASNRVTSREQVPLNSSNVERLEILVELLVRHKSFFEAQAKSIAETFRLDRGESYPMQLSSLESVPPSTSQPSQNSNRLAGNLRFYPEPSGSHASLPSPAERLSEAAISHLLKITRILYQTNQQWGLNASVELEPHATSRFDTYRNMMLRSSFARTFPSGDLGEANMYTQIELRWNGLTNVQKDEFVVRMARENDQIAAYLTFNTEETQKILEDELNALGDVISEVANNQRTQSTPTLMKIDLEEIKRFEVTEVYSHPDAKVDIVLVHGLNGDPRRTWQSENGTFWPSELLPVSLKSAHARVLVYGYKADAYAFSGRSRYVFAFPIITARLIRSTPPCLPSKKKESIPQFFRRRRSLHNRRAFWTTHVYDFCLCSKDEVLT
jgi:glycerophosphoryl diester phosphodiesterase